MTPRPRPRPAPGARKRARGPMRKSRRTITHVHPQSVLKLSIFMYSCFFVVWLLFAAILYNLVASTGVIDAMTEIINVFGTEGDEFKFTFGVAMKWAIVLGILGVVIGSLVNAALAFLYNVANDVVGGVQLTFSEKDE